ncbi:MAG: hypothetical protein MR433_08770 [Coriobacteriaceae bacterium]|nr:hypothetical protein [Coriobacteriaceae bacterium]MDD7111583.1 hypothetical protein [Coriobacteriaceae bacterium]MDY5808982.1 hypothetical protein [Coriobacteriales bacterium]
MFDPDTLRAGAFEGIFFIEPETPVMTARRKAAESSASLDTRGMAAETSGEIFRDVGFCATPRACPGWPGCGLFACCCGAAWFGLRWEGVTFANSPVTICLFVCCTGWGSWMDCTCG